MPASAEIRAWANFNGYNLPERGNIPMTVRKDFDAAHEPAAHEPAGGGPPPAGTRPDYPDGDFDALFDDPGPETPGEAAAGETAEARPRRPRPGRARPARRAGLFGGKPKPKAKAKAEKKPRVSVEGVLSSLWRGAAKLAAPLPPLQRTLRVQAPVAGLLLEDAVRDTALDMFLQPFARLEAQGKVVSALAGPPLIVTALSVHLTRAQQAGLEPNPMVMAVGTEALRSSLMAWMDVAGPKFAVAVAREKEFEDKYGSSVDEFIAMLFAPPAVTQADAAAEEEAIRRAQGIVADA